MVEVGGIEVTLTGGPLDGDTIQLSPRGSIEPPGMLTYLTVHNGQACYMVYGYGRMGVTDGWPADNTRIQYEFWGFTLMELI